MSSFFTALKADLLDRRLLPVLALTLVALGAAIVYAVTGGTSSSAPPQAVTAIKAPSGLSVSEAPQNTAAAVAETTSGAQDQRQGSARNPFTLLPGAVTGESKAAEGSSAKGAASSASGTTGSSTTSSGTSSEKSSSPSSGAGEGSTQTKSTTPSPKKAKTKTTYEVSVLFGVVPAGSAPGSAQLTPDNNIKLLTPLPSAKQPLVVFRGVLKGSEATFTLIGEAILHGTASCLPSETQCQELVLQTGQAEQLEYLGPAGEPVTYEVRLLSVQPTTASAASVRGRFARASKASARLLRHAALRAAGLRATATPGVLAFASPAQAARVALSAVPVAPSN